MSDERARLIAKIEEQRERSRLIAKIGEQRNPKPVQAAPMNEQEQFMMGEPGRQQQAEVQATDSRDMEAEGLAAAVAQEKRLQAMASEEEGWRRTRGGTGRITRRNKDQGVTDEEKMELLKRSSSGNRFATAAGSQVVRGGLNVANKVDNFVSNQLGDDEKGGGLISDEYFSEVDRKHDATKANTGLAGTLGGVAGDMLLTAPLDALGGGALRLGAKALRSTSAGARWADNVSDAYRRVEGSVAEKMRLGDLADSAATVADKVSDTVANATGLKRLRAARSAERGSKGYVPTAVATEHAAKLSAHEKGLAKARKSLEDAENSYGPLKQEAIAAEKRSQLIEDTWRAQRGPRGDVMDHMDQMFAESAHKDPALRALSGLDDMQIQANSMTRHLKGWQDVYRDGRRAAKKATKNADDAQKAIDRSSGIIESSPEVVATLARAKNVAKGKDIQKVRNASKKELAAATENLDKVKEKAVANRAKAQERAARQTDLGRGKREVAAKQGAGEQLAGDLAALGDRPMPNAGRRAGAMVADSNALQSAVGGALSGAVLADEGQSLQAGALGGALGAKLGAGQDLLQAGKGTVAAAAQKVPAWASYTQDKVLNRVLLRGASGSARKYKENIISAVDTFSGNAERGGLKRTIDRIRNVGAGNSGAAGARELMYGEEEQR
jgi:hypothetical protein